MGDIGLYTSSPIHHSHLHHKGEGARLLRSSVNNGLLQSSVALSKTLKDTEYDFFLSVFST